MNRCAIVRSPTHRETSTPECQTSRKVTAIRHPTSTVKVHPTSPLPGYGESAITSRHAASAASLSSLESGAPNESNAARTASTGVCSTGISSVKLLAVGTGTYSMGSHVQYASPFSVPPPLSVRNAPSSSEWAHSLRKSGT